MYTKTLTKLLAFSGAAICLGTTPGSLTRGAAAKWVAAF